ncbi:hypothetical protein LCGC14_2653460, partial [marine sediment metagenome]
ATINALAITANKIDTSAVITDKINALAVTAGKIALLTITAAQIANNTITAGQITALTITNAQIANNTIGAGQIAALTITAAEIANLTITAGQIANLTITTGNVGAEQITDSDSSIVSGTHVANTTESIINTITVPTDSNGTCVLWAAARIDNAQGDSLSLRIRKDNVTGSILHSQLFTPIDNNMRMLALLGEDSAPTGNQVYVLTAATLSGTANVINRSLTGVNRKK